MQPIGERFLCGKADLVVGYEWTLRGKSSRKERRVENTQRRELGQNHFAGFARKKSFTLRLLTNSYNLRLIQCEIENRSFAGLTVHIN